MLIRTKCRCSYGEPKVYLNEIIYLVSTQKFQKTKISCPKIHKSTCANSFRENFAHALNE